MLYVCWNSETNEIFSCLQLNKYELEYYGAWHTEVEREIHPEEAAGMLAGLGLQEKNNWRLLNVDEHALKRFNVKINNNPQARLYFDGKGRSWVVKEQ
ncbi:hypothetical protein [Paenibacillus sp. 32O-W]|uniref:hypothetical protein n=1 Tax=Paenibacillus sp. 32O-W TaxID=1695218 RepID=UPI0011A722AF|nr:hypothetical protein [Paenibacillus sp. 32O-W]